MTKQALVDYYLAVAPRMVPHVAGRPLSLVRCPNGAGQKCFYQKQLGSGHAIRNRRGGDPESQRDATETYVTVHSGKAWLGWRR